MLIQREIEPKIKNFLIKSKFRLLFIWGPRRSGKTTLLRKLAKEYKVPIFDFDFLSEREKFLPTKEALEKIAAEHKIILIDEVQNAPEATVALKILVDHFKVKIIATGSSELRQKSGEEFDSLADRFEEYFCLPLTTEEIINDTALKKYEVGAFTQILLEKLQIFGGYPEIYSGNLAETEKIGKLQKIVDAYVLKDIIDIYDLKNTKLAKDILTKIALQLGSEVSVREIASSLGANMVTVSNYIEIFIRNYILIPLPAFKTNLRRAVSENRKLYFYDLGIRNALIRDFRETSLRQDAGGVWENLVISELAKSRLIKNKQETFYFYREYSGKEVDLVIEDYKKRYKCLEIKKSGKKISRVFPLKHRLESITQKNFIEQLISK